jgi:hypothetical protein
VPVVQGATPGILVFVERSNRVLAEELARLPRGTRVAIGEMAALSPNERTVRKDFPEVEWVEDSAQAEAGVVPPQGGPLPPGARGTAATPLLRFWRRP